jgi:hypothetical protein
MKIIKEFLRELFFMPLGYAVILFFMLSFLWTMLISFIRDIRSNQIGHTLETGSCVFFVVVIAFLGVSILFLIDKIRTRK